MVIFTFTFVCVYAFAFCGFTFRLVHARLRFALRSGCSCVWLVRILRLGSCVHVLAVLVPGSGCCLRYYGLRLRYTWLPTLHTTYLWLRLFGWFTPAFVGYYLPHYARGCIRLLRLRTPVTLVLGSVYGSPLHTAVRAVAVYGCLYAFCCYALPAVYVHARPHTVTPAVYIPHLPGCYCSRTTFTLPLRFTRFLRFTTGRLRSLPRSHVLPLRLYGYLPRLHCRYIYLHIATPCVTTVTTGLPFCTFTTATAFAFITPHVPLRCYVRCWLRSYVLCQFAFCLPTCHPVTVVYFGSFTLRLLHTHATRYCAFVPLFCHRGSFAHTCLRLPHSATTVPLPFAVATLHTLPRLRLRLFVLRLRSFPRLIAGCSSLRSLYILRFYRLVPVRSQRLPLRTRTFGYALRFLLFAFTGYLFFI